MKDQVIILAAGKGSRLKYDNLPKVLVPFKGQVLIKHLLMRIGKIIQNIKPVVVVGFMGDKVKAVLGNRFEYVKQEEQLGTAHAVKAAKKNIQAENVLVLYGDMPFISEHSLRRLIRLHHDEEANISMFTASVPNFENEYDCFLNYGRILRSYNKEIIKITEFKDATESEKQIKEINPGIYMFNSEWLWKNIKKIKNKNAQREYYLTDIVEIAIKEKEKIYSLPIEPREIIGINSMEDLLAAEKML
ncbi:MAG: hypothetical protein COT92_03065 [Candidatus Doudnabacteria bacterium CG10_big_fil_rev_8_21_14_0_10_42_18]|uniref:MobA-like NTP transferase domain-containing protein n=1 Tax=Candidatus Doudnabacteria bacterium CG10_big_fil_rev_8_21_14_0_10_42_18 TaxID=1974552 RepID=A0A2H0VAE8_9BACT|nr:MAG: hypothetical protein COT92_03065 [Candidatus Doudnabacteria bacterium CG10_big_fil_rev_8_21_14_0_10_42_18]